MSAVAAAPPAVADDDGAAGADCSCRHCGQPLDATATAGGFCCSGCAAAFDLVQGLGLARYYERRCIDPDARPTRPDETAGGADCSAHVRRDTDGSDRLHLMVDGLHCAACVWLIETALARLPGVRHARLNMTTRRLTVAWDPQITDAATVAGVPARLGYRIVPYDPERLASAAQEEEKELLRAMGVAGFAAANVMLLSVSVWAGYSQGMGTATRDLMHWMSALICLPAIAYSVRPFARSAFAALRVGRTNMDVPICVGVTLAAAMSVFETANSGLHAYFDGAVMLLFFLLIGRYLDRRARGRARSAAEQLLGLTAVSVTILDPDGRVRVVRPEQVAAGDTALAAAGDRVPVDGEVIDGVSDLDASLITGETVPISVKPGERVFAGALNLTAPLRIRATAVGEGTLLAEIVRLMEVAEQGRARYVAVADRVSRYYAPVVHLAALGTFLGWWLWPGDAVWQDALMNAVAVLIITCPCALGLAVPVVQVIASGRLLRRGVLLKSATALERLAEVDAVAFDKTGTLTAGKPLPQLDGLDREALTVAASLAASSRHPLARALAQASPAVAAEGVRETPGAGLSLTTPDGEIRLGSRAFAGPADTGDTAESGDLPGPEIWLARPGHAPLRIPFHDRPRVDARAVVDALKARGMAVSLLSGDRRSVVAAMAQTLGIADWRAGQSPADKTAALEALRGQGRRVLMVGDGLNDAPALAAATVSISPSTAVDVSQTAADVVFQGDKLGPIIETLDVARRAERLVRQNLILAVIYNVVAAPMAMAGQLTPLLAALAMSSSSLIVILNALRLTRRG